MWEKSKIAFSGMRDAISSQLERVIRPSSAAWAAHVADPSGVRNTRLLCSCRKVAPLLLEVVFASPAEAEHGLCELQGRVWVWDGGCQRGLNLQSNPVGCFISTSTPPPSFPASPAQEGMSTSLQAHPGTSAGNRNSSLK